MIGRVERPPDVLGDDVVEDGDLAGLAVDPDVDEVRRGQRREDRRDGAAVALERLELAAKPSSIPADLGQRQRRAPASPSAGRRRRPARGR